jgi:transcriptional regulator with XRE-family HTH domain
MSATRRQAARAFGQALRAARQARGISQEQLAETGDFDRTYPSLLERGLRTPTFFVILSLAEGLNIDPVALFRDAVARVGGQVSP